MNFYNSTPDIYVLGGEDSLKFSDQLTKLGGSWQKMRDNRMGWAFDKESYQKAIKWMDTMVNLGIIYKYRGKYRVVNDHKDGPDGPDGSSFQSSKDISKNYPSAYENHGKYLMKNQNDSNSNVENNLNINNLKLKFMKTLISIQCNMCYDTVYKIWPNDTDHYLQKWVYCNQNIVLFYNSLDEMNQKLFLNYFNE